MTETIKRQWKSGDIATGETKTSDLGDYAVTDPKIGTGEVKTRAVEDYAVTDPKIGTGEVKTRAVEDYAVTDPKIGTGEVKARALNKDQGEGTVTDADTELPHNLGVTPVIFEFHPTTGGVTGYLMESTRSATSVTLQGNVSGVYAKWTVQG